MDEIKGVRIVSLTGEKEYGIEDSEVREELANVVDGAPEELDSFKEAFEKFKEGGEVLAGITESVERNAEAIAAETERAQNAEQLLDEKIAGEVHRAKMAEQGIKVKALDASSAEYEATENTVALKLATIEGVGDEITIPAATTELAGVMTAEDKKKIDENKKAIEEEIKRAKEAEAKAIEQGKREALIDMYRAIGASYNSSTDTFTFNTVAGLSWPEMAATYSYRDIAYRLELPRVGQQISNLRVINPISNILTSSSIEIQGLNTFYGTNIELLALCKLSSTTYNPYLNAVRVDTAPVCTYLYDTFRLCSKLKVVFPINIKGCQTLKKECFSGCVALEELRLLNLPLSLNLDGSPLISKASILYIITNAAPTSAITITLHPDAFARLSEDADIVAALEAQPLVTLVSA